MTRQEEYIGIIEKVIENNCIVTMDSDFLLDLHFDSMQMVFLITILEEKYSINIDIKDITNISKVHELYNLIKGKIDGIL